MLHFMNTPNVINLPLHYIVYCMLGLVETWTSTKIALLLKQLTKSLRRVINLNVFYVFSFILTYDVWSGLFRNLDPCIRLIVHVFNTLYKIGNLVSSVLPASRKYSPAEA